MLWNAVDSQVTTHVTLYETTSFFRYEWHDHGLIIKYITDNLLSFAMFIKLSNNQLGK